MLLRHALHALFEALQVVGRRAQLCVFRQPVVITGAAKQRVVLHKMLELTTA